LGWKQPGTITERCWDRGVGLDNTVRMHTPVTGADHAGIGGLLVPAPGLVLVGWVDPHMIGKHIRYRVSRVMRWLMD
jgi:hypothetical protein